MQVRYEEQVKDFEKLDKTSNTTFRIVSGYIRKIKKEINNARAKPPRFPEA